MRNAVIAAVTIFGALLTACGGAASGNRTTTSPIDRPSSRPVGASGMVIARSARQVIFCGGPLPTSLTWGPPECSGIRVHGVNLSALSYRQRRRGVTWGTAYLAGLLRNGVLHVIEQAPPKTPATGTRLGDPPCPAPPAGWTVSHLNNLSTDAVAAYRRQFPADITSVAVFHPRRMISVITIASTMPFRTNARLSSAYPSQLCVVRSRYEPWQVRAASRAALALLSSGSYAHRPYRVTGVGRTVGADGQPIVEVNVVAITPALRHALALQPARLIKIEPWLKSVSLPVSYS
jgi:hypothetical protein